jgi:hypothetical protein
MYTLGINAAFHDSAALRREDRGGSHSPPYAIFWRLYGALRYRVAFF